MKVFHSPTLSFQPLDRCELFKQWEKPSGRKERLCCQGGRGSLPYFSPVVPWARLLSQVRENSWKRGLLRTQLRTDVWMWQQRGTVIKPNQTQRSGTDTCLQSATFIQCQRLLHRRHCHRLYPLSLIVNLFDNGIVRCYRWWNVMVNMESPNFQGSERMEGGGNWRTVIETTSHWAHGRVNSVPLSHPQGKRTGHGHVRTSL